MYQYAYPRRDRDSSNMGGHESDRSSRGTVPSSLPSLDHQNSSVDTKFDSPSETHFFDNDDRASLNTYCTTVASFDEDDDDFSDSDDDPYDPYKFPLQPEAVPATPYEYERLFPSTRRLLIKHDDSTLDGNMNVRVDTEESGNRLTLFHLRMYDLRDRDFSFRRYGRDCGREICHIKRKFIKPSPARPSLQRSVSKAFQRSFRGKTEESTSVASLARSDSGYASNFDEEEYEEKDCTNDTAPKPTNSCTLEFSNYAHVDLSRRGGKQSKKYDFDYWDKTYSWKRVLKVDATSGAEEVEFQLVCSATRNIVAQIKPDVLTPETAAAEQAKGGFVPPCSFWLKESEMGREKGDVADVIVATGLLALIDDSIKRKFHKKKSVLLVLPVPGAKTPLKMNMEYVGPKRLVDELFHRRPTPPSRTQSATTATGASTPTPGPRKPAAQRMQSTW